MSTVKDGDLTTGPVKEVPYAKVEPRPQRIVEMWKGEPPQSSDGKVAIQFTLPNKECGLDDQDPKTGKKFKCKMKLQVTRVKNAIFDRDLAGFSGQLNYKEDDIRQYLSCPVHGPSPPGPSHW